MKEDTMSQDETQTGLAAYRAQLRWLAPSQAIRTVAIDALVIVATIVAVVVLVCLAVLAVQAVA